MERTKATVRKLPVIVNQQQRIGNNNILNIRLRNMPFKIKRIRPLTKRVDAKKKWASSKTNERQKRSDLLNFT